MNWLIDHLAQTQFQRDAAEQVGMNVAEAPTADEQVDHAMGCGAGGCCEVFSGFNHHPSVGSGVGSGSLAGFDNRPGQWLTLAQMKAKGYVERAFDAVDADFAVALGRMPISAAEQRASVIDGKVERRTRAAFAHVEVAPEGARRPRAKGAIVGACDSHDAQKGPDGHNCGRERMRCLAVKKPMKEVRLAGGVFQKAKALDDAGPAPAGMPGGEDVDLQHVAGLRAFDPEWPGEGVNPGAIDAQIFCDGHPRLHLPATRVDALDLHFGTRLDAET